MNILELISWVTAWVLIVAFLTGLTISCALANLEVIDWWGYTFWTNIFWSALVVFFVRLKVEFKT